LVLVTGCLFAGEVQSTEGFSVVDAQANYAAPNITFDTASLLPPCGNLGGLVPVIRRTQELHQTSMVWEYLADDSKPSGRQARGEEFIEISLTTFSHISYAGDGAAVHVSRPYSVVVLRSDAFVNCSTTGEDSCGGCAYLAPVATGTVVDTCASGCESWAGSFAYFTGSARTAIELKGLSLFGCLSSRGAIDYRNVGMTAFQSNFTRLNGAPNAGDGAAVMYEDEDAATNGSFRQIEDSSTGIGCFYKWSMAPAVFRSLNFVNNLVGAIAHRAGGNDRGVLLLRGHGAEGR
jgi:hypothetical protein